MYLLLFKAEVASLESKLLESEKRLLETENSGSFDRDISVEMNTSTDEFACNVANCFRRENNNLSGSVFTYKSDR